MPTENPRARCYPSLPTGRQRSELSEGLHSSSHRCLPGSTDSPTKTLSASSVSRLGGVLPALLIAELLRAPQHPHSPLLDSAVCPCPSCSGGARTGYGAPGTAPWVLSRGYPAVTKGRKPSFSFLPAFQPPDATLPTSGHIILAEIRAALTTQIHSLSAALP